MPRGKGKNYSSAQRRGTEFGGATQQNGIQPHRSVDDLSAKERAMLIKRTGQEDRADALAQERNWLGQEGLKPKTKREDRMPPPGYYD